ncbi:8650_t:CDS:2 [Ambispora leptoticha]|uniref:8650_t:CDS:1 n=1 Tax=Ambispora leptoticha TaxID=144679 RepID=A0A9N9G339_9GLOM|nr:8650_t:CDS:2 [Ambispora leptoticha]
MSSRQANQASIRKDTQVRLAELKGVALNSIPYPRSNAILTQYQEEIRNLEKKANYQSEIDSIDKLAGPEKDGSITWFSRRIPKLASQKKLNNHEIEYWKLSPNVNKSHITYEYINKIRNLMDDDKEYIIGIINSWEMDRMERQIQFDNNNIPIDLKEKWVSEEKHEWKIKSKSMIILER